MEVSDRTAYGKKLWEKSATIVWIRRHSLVCFFLIAFGLTWLFRFLPQYAESRGWIALPSWYGSIAFITFFGPSLAAIAIAAIMGKKDLGDLVSRSLRWRAGIKWYAAAIFIPMLTMLAAVTLFVLLGGPMPGFYLLKQYWYLLLPYLVFCMITGGAVGEEIGWRGFAQPRLQGIFGEKKYGIIITTLIVGFAWGLWYAPNFFIPGTDSYQLFGTSMVIAFILTEVGNAFLITWIFNGARGSALVSGLLTHAALNTWSLVLLVNMTDLNAYVPIDPRLVILNCLMVWAVAVILVVATKGRLGAPQDKVAEEQMFPP